MRNVALRPQPIVLATKPGNLRRRVRSGMRGRRRYRVPRRPRIPPSASIAPVAQHRGGEAQLACDPAQRPTAAHQQGYRFPLELVRKMTPSLAHSTPVRSRRSLAKVSTNSREPQPKTPPRAWTLTRVNLVPAVPVPCVGGSRGGFRDGRDGRHRRYQNYETYRPAYLRNVPAFGV